VLNRFISSNEERRELDQRMRTAESQLSHETIASRGLRGALQEAQRAAEDNEWHLQEQLATAKNLLLLEKERNRELQEGNRELQEQELRMRAKLEPLYTDQVAKVANGTTVASVATVATATTVATVATVVTAPTLTITTPTPPTSPARPFKAAFTPPRNSNSNSNNNSNSQGSTKKHDTERMKNVAQRLSLLTRTFDKDT
jgi:hypothetical protein